jgi:hypothetical protein
MRDARHGDCRLAWFVTGSVGVKRPETRCEGGGVASGHKRGHNAAPPLAPGRTVLTAPRQARRWTAVREHIVLTRRPGRRFVGGGESYLKGLENRRQKGKPAPRGAVLIGAPDFGFPQEVALVADEMRMGSVLFARRSNPFHFAHPRCIERIA